MKVANNAEQKQILFYFSTMIATLITRMNHPNNHSVPDIYIYRCIPLKSFKQGELSYCQPVHYSLLFS